MFYSIVNILSTAYLKTTYFFVKKCKAYVVHNSFLLRGISELTRVSFTNPYEAGSASITGMSTPLYVYAHHATLAVFTLRECHAAVYRLRHGLMAYIDEPRAEVEKLCHIP